MNYNRMRELSAFKKNKKHWKAKNPQHKRHRHHYNVRSPTTLHPSTHPYDSYSSSVKKVIKNLFLGNRNMITQNYWRLLTLCCLVTTAILIAAKLPCSYALLLLFSCYLLDPALPPFTSLAVIKLKPCRCFHTFRFGGEIEWEYLQKSFL